MKGNLSTLGRPEHRNITTAIFLPHCLNMLMGLHISLQLVFGSRNEAPICGEKGAKRRGREGKCIQGTFIMIFSHLY